MSIEGIENYAPDNSKNYLCKYLTFSNGIVNNEHYLNVNDYISGTYKYNYISFSGKVKETALIVLHYDDSNYETVIEKIQNEQGFSEELDFSYGNFHFYLNKTETACRRKESKQPLTTYDMGAGEKRYVSWINLVGFSFNKKSVMFLGFCNTYHSSNNNGSITFARYKTDMFGDLLEEEFDFFNWFE